MTELHASAAALSRRGFLASTAAIAGGFSLGFHLPLDEAAAQTVSGSPEVNAWVVIRPDETVVVRVGVHGRSRSGSSVRFARSVHSRDPSGPSRCGWPHRSSDRRGSVGRRLSGRGRTTPSPPCGRMGVC